MFWSSFLVLTDSCFLEKYLHSGSRHNPAFGKNSGKRNPYIGGYPQQAGIGEKNWKKEGVAWLRWVIAIDTWSYLKPIVLVGIPSRDSG
ncbi:hypothetical protein [Methanosphaerula palustris]|uniref:hypothetical protein n=1 Tax=Methanosphaerula palustris TaxID=475088 RepID=UPI0011D16B19|nr:hypothetical protein [Methanosphaerula palustris]